MTRQRLILLALILLAFFLRTWRLPQTPPGLWYDEGYYGMDALWMVETGHYPPFVPGNNGRESLWLYLLALSTSILGNTPFAIRWTGSLAGLLAIPIIYSLARALSGVLGQASDKRLRDWFALAATGWLALSWWHLHISRAGFRLVLLSPILMLSLYFFWRGWTGRGRWLANFALAGFFLGLSQYTYLPARLAPLVFAGLVLTRTIQHAFRSDRSPQAGPAARAPGSIREPLLPPVRPLKDLWTGLLLSLFVAGLVFTPLGLFFLDHPEALSARTDDVIFKPDNLGQGIAHLLQGLSLFFGAGHELYRHHLPGRAMLGWLEIPFFWAGLIRLLRPASLRRPQPQWLLLGLFIMWLPALLASPPAHALRPIGLMPFYYLIVTVGTYQIPTGLLHLLAFRYRPPLSQNQPTLAAYAFPLTFAIFVGVNTLVNTYDYFWRWAYHPEVYKEYNTPLVELVDHLLAQTQTTDILIPFHIYVHPTTRYLLWRAFPEMVVPPGPPEGGEEEGGRPVKMVLIPDTFQILYVGNIPASPAWVLLTRDGTGQGRAYVSRPPRAAEQQAINGLPVSKRQVDTFNDRLGRSVAQFISLTAQDQQALTPLFETAPLRTVRVDWAGLARLDGYDVTPDLVQPGQPLLVNLYWHSLADATFDYRLFLQVVDSAGQPVHQWEGDAFREDMYRWRPNGILPTQHTLWLGPETPPGPYFIRLGFFDHHTGERLPIAELANRPVNSAAPPPDQVHLGLFYVSPDGTDPRVPATPLSANFAEAIELTGVTLPEIEEARLSTPISNLNVIFHWRAYQPTDKPYTVFLQLLDEKGEVVAGWDSQPFNGLYPTTLWSPGEILADTFHLPMPEGGLPPGSYRLITGFYDFETFQRLPLVSGGDFAELGSFMAN